jgi:hypothetical protein
MPAASEPSQPAAEAPKPVPQVARPAPEAAKAAVPKRPPAVAAATQPVTVITSPGGATAMMDGRPETACQTPCSIEAAPGRHTVTVSMEGYEMQRHEVDVRSSPVEMLPLVLHATGGTLMLSSVPSGARVLVNGKAIQKTTPAEIRLAPGTYKITVEKDGKQSTQTVQVTSGISVLRIPIQP